MKHCVKLNEYHMKMMKSYKESEVFDKESFYLGNHCEIMHFDCWYDVSGASSENMTAVISSLLEILISSKLKLKLSN